MPVSVQARAMPIATGWRGLWLALLMVVTLATPAARGQPQDLPEDPLTVLTDAGPRKFTVEVATSPAERSRGLMHRTDLALDRGMLFDFGREQPVSMWMRNTLIPLDMLFIDEAGEVRKIAAQTEPLSLESIASGVPVRAVLELKGGTTRLLDIETGDRVVHPIFAPPDREAITPAPRTPG